MAFYYLNYPQFFQEPPQTYAYPSVIDQPNFNYKNI